MGRAPCCDKANVKRGPWSPEEDAKLKAYIEQHGTGGNWIALPEKIGLKRCGKSCRLRWLNYLRPNIKHGGFSDEEDNIICNLYGSIGSRWSIIAAQLPGRTDNDIKNYWNTKLKKKLLGKNRKEQQARRESCVKQEMKRESENFTASDSMNLYPYWPMLPVTPLPVVNPKEEPYLEDQASIRNLLIKLGGRFSDHYQLPDNTITNFQYPFDISSTQDNENFIQTTASPTSMSSINSTCSQLLNTDYFVNGADPNMFQGLNNFPIELDNIVYGNPQQFGGPESFSGVGKINGSIDSSPADSTSWADISSLICPTMVSNYESFQQEMVQDCAFGELRYTNLL